jgi:excisionase family DNA binding protein
MAGIEKYISQTEAARLRGVSKQAIANLIKRGRLSAIQIAGRSLLHKSEVEAFVAQPRTGRPKKKQASKKTAAKKKSAKS